MIVPIGSQPDVSDACRPTVFPVSDDSAPGSSTTTADSVSAVSKRRQGPIAATAEPRLPEGLSPLRDPRVEDQTEWTDVEVTGEVQVPPEVLDVEVASSRLAGLRLTGCRFVRLRLVDVVLEDCDLAAATIAEASLVRVEFRRCRMSWLVGAGLRAKDVRISDAKMDEANLRRSQWERLTVEGSDLRGGDFYDAQLPAARLLGCDLMGAEFGKANLTGALLHGSGLEGVRGADALRGVVIGSDQMLPLTTSLLVALGIVVDDDHPDSNPRRTEQS
jgi:hypothetical protein